MKVKKILISQPTPTPGSPYSEIISKYGVSIDFVPFFRVVSLSAREFRVQKINITDYTAIVFTSKSAIDSFFGICEEMRIVVPETMKYFCSSESVALYLQKHIIYRKRKIFFGSGTAESIIDIIGVKHKDENFLIATTDNARPELMKLFTKSKFKCANGVFNKTFNCDLSGINLSKYQMMVFYSPSDVKSLLENFPDFQQGETIIATFGPSALKAVKNAGMDAQITAPTPEAPSMAKALLLYLEKNK